MKIESKRTKNILWGIVLCLCAVSCGTHKTITEKEVFSAFSVLERAVENTAWKGGFTSKVKFDLQFGTGNYSLNGTMRIKKDEALQLSLQIPFLGMEAVRIEATPEKIMVIDRIHKKYVEEPIASLSALSQTGLDYYALQAVFTGMLFRPGAKEFTADDLARMEQQEPSAGVVRLRYAEKGLDYQFDLHFDKTRMFETTISKPTSAYRLDWVYTTYQNLSGYSFPTRIKATFEGYSKEMGLGMELSRLTQSTDWQTTSVPSRYEKIRLEDVMKMFPTL